MTTIALLDDKNKLVGYKKKKDPSVSDVVVPDGCDLPGDGSYWYDAEAGAFFPIGRGLGKPKRPPVEDKHVLYLMARAMGGKAPQEVKEWADWYNDNILREIR